MQAEVTMEKAILDRDAQIIDLAQKRAEPRTIPATGWQRLGSSERARGEGGTGRTDRAVREGRTGARRAASQGAREDQGTARLGERARRPRPREIA